MERIVNRRLHSILEKQQLLDPRQYAFRAGKSTDDYFDYLEILFDTHLNQHHHIECLSLDLSKAFDRVDRIAIINQLVKWNIGGRLLHYINNFLTNRRIQVLTNGVRSQMKPIHGGVPQGSVIAPTLFLIAINTLFQIIPNNITTLTYADDILLISTSPFPILARRRLQSAVHLVEDWAPTVGFQFSPAKSKLLHLGPNRRKLRKLPPLTMLSQTIPLVHSFRLLGVWVDDRLNFRCHLNKMRKNSTNKINIPKILTNKTSSAHRDSLFRFLHGWLIPSILYGLGFISRELEEVCLRLEPIYNECVRLISSAFRTSPIPSLMAESDQLPFQYLIAKHLSSKALRTMYNSRSNNSLKVKRTNDLLIKLTGDPLPNICPRLGPNIRHWNDSIPKVDLTLKQQIKAGNPPAIVLPNFLQLIQNKYLALPHIYTDGSKDNNGNIGCGIHDGVNNRSHGLPKMCTVFSAEAYALLDAVERSSPHSIIFSDSASVLTAIAAGNLQHTWVYSISEIAPSKNITLCWVPGHCGIAGNEAADRLASAGTSLPPTINSIPQSDAMLHLKNRICHSWGSNWTATLSSKLREVKNTTEKWQDRPNIIERRALTRLRIGHTRLTQAYLITKEDPPNCPSCQVPITVKHILTSCLQYQPHRLSCSLATSLRQIVSCCPEEEKKLISFLKKSKLLNQI
ncbi:uncharacterized protein LOC129737714 [Uranotaenia lowii]|uniref:uncharacterized protein LOC129737714 n=1 Tax=Uranotaenia lowii TaxID=190385 RepID=UPI002478843B|nr:uncharacterized protein LOC129737714 [Uranotaenia lowii]